MSAAAEKGVVIFDGESFGGPLPGGDPFAPTSTVVVTEVDREAGTVTVEPLFGIPDSQRARAALMGRFRIP